MLLDLLQGLDIFNEHQMNDPIIAIFLGNKHLFRTTISNETTLSDRQTLMVCDTGRLDIESLSCKGALCGHTVLSVQSDMWEMVSWQINIA